MRLQEVADVVVDLALSPAHEAADLVEDVLLGVQQRVFLLDRFSDVPGGGFVDHGDDLIPQGIERCDEWVFVLFRDEPVQFVRQLADALRPFAAENPRIGAVGRQAEQFLVEVPLRGSGTR